MSKNPFYTDRRYRTVPVRILYGSTVAGTYSLKDPLKQNNKQKIFALIFMTCVRADPTATFTPQI